MDLLFECMTIMKLVQIRIFDNGHVSNLGWLSSTVVLLATTYSRITQTKFTRKYDIIVVLFVLFNLL
jgi:hypothetical protein